LRHALIAVALVAVFVVAIAAHGIPVLRHDWFWPVDADSRRYFLSAFTSGWDPTGFGSARPRLTMYVLAIPLWLCMEVLGNFLALVCFLAATAAVTFLAAFALCRDLRAPLPASYALAAFALFNPWVYSEAVAGHITAVLAYGISIDLVRLLMRADVRPAAIGLRLAFVLGQPQLYVLDVVAIALFFWRSADVRRGLALGLAFALPFAVGIAGDSASLLSIPYVADWQRSQSVAPVDAFALLGYFAKYTDRADLYFRYAGWAIAASALAGVLVGGRRTRVAGAAACAIACLAFVTGTRGPLGAIYERLVLAFPQSGFFRELYLLLAFVAIAYVVLAAIASARFPAIGFVAAAASAACVAAWIVAPPSGWFVSASALPRPTVDASPFSRFALVPGVQPLVSRFGGSGADPDVYPRGSTTPLNAYSPTYPADAAFGEYGARGDTRWLGALSVTSIVERPWLRRDDGSLKDQMALPRRSGTVPGSRRIAGAPELALVSRPGVASLAREPDRSAIFFADADGSIGAPAFRPYPAARGGADLAGEWVDARFAFFAHPELAQGLGGVATASSQPLPLGDGRWLLVGMSSGTLSDDRGDVVMRGSGFRWVRVADGTRSVACAGLCEVVGSADRRPPFPMEPAAAASTALTFARPFDWLVVASVPSSRPGDVVRFNEAFDRGWIAWSSGLLQHERLDTAANGWVLRTGAPSSVIVLHVVAAAQFVLEILCLALALLMMARSARDGSRA